MHGGDIGGSGSTGPDPQVNLYVISFMVLHGGMHLQLQPHHPPVPRQKGGSQPGLFIPQLITSFHRQKILLGIRF